MTAQHQLSAVNQKQRDNNDRGKYFSLQNTRKIG